MHILDTHTYFSLNNKPPVKYCVDPHHAVGA